MLDSLDVLVVEDDPALRDVIVVALEAQGHRVRACDDGGSALAACDARRPDLVVLDVMLPGRSGIEVCAALRALHGGGLGVVLVTARADEVDVVLGLEAGADDYVIKPFRPRELVARVKALGRRVRAAHPAPAEPRERDGSAFGALRVDFAARLVTVDGRRVSLTPTERAVLLFLARNAGRVVSRAELLSAVWETEHDGYARNVDSHVTRLRKKLEAAGLADTPIRTVHGVGYELVAR